MSAAGSHLKSVPADFNFDDAWAAADAGRERKEAEAGCNLRSVLSGTATAAPPVLQVVPTPAGPVAVPPVVAEPVEATPEMKPEPVVVAPLPVVGEPAAADLEAQPARPAPSRKLSPPERLAALADQHIVEVFLGLDGEPSAEINIADDRKIALVLKSEEFEALILGWAEEAGEGAQPAHVRQAIKIISARVTRAALMAPLPALPPVLDATAEDEEQDAAALAALRAVVPRLRPAGENQVVADFNEGRGLDVGLITELELGWALPPADQAGDFPNYAMGGAAEGVPGNWWATGHNDITLFHSVEDDQVLSARARYCGTAKIEKKQKSLGPKKCPVAGSWARCRRVAAYVRGEAPAPRVWAICEGEMDFRAVATALHKLGRVDVGTVGIVSGCWTQASADKIPVGAIVILLTHSDRAGCSYRDKIARSLGKKAQLRVRHRFSTGDDKLADENDKMRELRDVYDPHAGLYDWQAPPTVWPLSDPGNAERLIHRHGGNLRFCIDTRIWLAWDQTRWLSGNAAMAEARMRALETIRIGVRDEEPPTPEARTELTRWALLSENLPLRQRCVDSAADMREIRVASAQLDADLHLVGVRNGVLDLRTRKLLTDPRSALVTRQVAAAYDPDAKCPVWERALLEIFQNQSDIVACLQRIVGYLLCGKKTKKLLVICHGPGGDNGKSVLLKAIAKLFGSYGGVFDPKIIFDRKAGDKDYASANLEGLRVGVMSEVDKDAQVSASHLKRLAGGSDDMPVERKYHDPKSIVTTAAMLLALNDVPPLPRDLPLLNRLLFMPFLRTFAKDEQDEQLPDKWEAEHDGIFAWAVRGYQAYVDRGIDPPAAVKAHTAEVKSTSDSVGLWIEAECVKGAGLETSRDDLLRAYSAWVGTQQEKHPDMALATETSFGIRLRKMGCGSYRDTSGRTIRTGIALKVRPVTDRSSVLLHTAASVGLA